MDSLKSKIKEILLKHNENPDEDKYEDTVMYFTTEEGAFEELINDIKKLVEDERKNL